MCLSETVVAVRWFSENCPGVRGTEAMAFSVTSTMATTDYNPTELESAGTTLDGPFTEPLAQGGATYYRCPGCGREVLAGRTANLSHASGCGADV